LGNKHKTIQDYLSIYDTHEFKWIGSVLPKRTNINTVWECRLGHTFPTSYHNITLSNTKCHKCTGKYVRQLNDYEELAKLKDLVWIGENVPKKIREKTKWKCHNDHIWIASYFNIEQVMGCKFCRLGYYIEPEKQSEFKSCKKRFVFEDFLDLANKKGLVWTGNLPPTSGIVPTNWRCKKCDYEEPITFRTLKLRKGGCQKCIGRAAKTETDYLNLAKLNNLEWIGEFLPKRTSDKTYWKCEKGHIKNVSYNYVTGKGGCQKCLNLIEEDYHEIAKEKGFEWIGKFLPKNSHTTTDWKCEKGHVWPAQYANIQQNKGCPYCKNKNEEECREIFEFLFDEKFPKRKPKWLKLLPNAKNLELDGFNEKLGIAFEYDGGQHFYPVKHWGGESYLKEIKERDRLKDEACKSRKIILIRIPYTVIDKKEHIVSQLALNGIQIGIKI
jgi:hypothetical protein